MTAEPFCFIDLDKNAIGQQIEGECEGDCGIQDFDVDLLEHLIVDDAQDEQDENQCPDCQSVRMGIYMGYRPDLCQCLRMICIMRSNVQRVDGAAHRK